MVMFYKLGGGGWDQWVQSSDSGCVLHVDYALLPAVRAADASGMAFGDAVWGLFCFLPPPVAADGAPLPGDTDGETET